MSDGEFGEFDFQHEGCEHEEYVTTWSGMTAFFTCKVCGEELGDKDYS